MRYFVYESREGSHWQHHKTRPVARCGLLRRLLILPFDIVMLPLALLALAATLLLYPLLNFILGRPRK